MPSILLKIKEGRRIIIDPNAGSVLAFVENEDGTASVMSITGHKLDLKDSFDAVAEAIAEAWALEMGEEIEEQPPVTNGTRRARKRISD